uniref:Uncharacterized protein n=1 Tax=Zea mays TaxID=4577 RepID=C0PA76_MAIZE|nr:unknown [Zea mays]
MDFSDLYPKSRKLHGSLLNPKGLPAKAISSCGPKTTNFFAGFPDAKHRIPSGSSGCSNGVHNVFAAPSSPFVRAFTSFSTSSSSHQGAKINLLLFRAVVNSSQELTT